MSKKPVKKNILLSSTYFFPEPVGISKYSGEMMEWLSKNGYNTTVITAFPHYPFWEIQKPYTNRWYKKEVINYPEHGTAMEIYRCPIYVPNPPSGKNRMIQEGLLWVAKFWVVLKHILLKKKFDLFITVSPPFHMAYLALLYKRLRGGKVVYHIQDLQIEAAQQLNILNSQKLFDLLFRIERGILNKVDFVSTISKGMQKKVEEKTGKKVLFFPNWADTAFFYPLDDKAAAKQKWNFNKNDFICLYSGSMGGKQGLENIIFAAKALRKKKELKFVIAGTGPAKAELMEMSKNEDLENVFFFPLQEKEHFNEFLNMADVHLIIQKGEASDLVMPSKLTTILAVGGVTIATASKGTSLFEVIDEYKIGIITKPDDTNELAAAIENAMNSDLDPIRKNARDYALKYLNIDNVMRTFLADVGIE